MNYLDKNIDIEDEKLKEKIYNIFHSFMDFMPLSKNIFISDKEIKYDVPCLLFIGDNKIESYIEGKKKFHIEGENIDEYLTMSISWLLNACNGFYKELSSQVYTRKKLLSVLEPLIVLMEVEDSRGYSHSQRVAKLFSDFCIFLGMDKSQIKLYIHYAMIHDVGRIGLEQLMLYSPTRLRNFEENGQDHTITGSVYISTLEVLNDFIPYVRNHHERWDGQGFPDGLKEEEIPYWVRALSIVNWYDNALNTVDSEFSSGIMSSLEALEQIEKDEGKMFDPSLATEFISFLKGAK